MKTLFALLLTAVAAVSCLAQPEVVEPTLDLTWQDNSTNETGFAIERRLYGGESSWQVIARTSADVVAYTDTAIEFGRAYEYRVRAFNEFGFSGYTNVAHGLAEDMRPDGVPSTLLVVFIAPNGQTYAVEFDPDGDPFLVKLPAAK